MLIVYVHVYKYELILKEKENWPTAKPVNKGQPREKQNWYFSTGELFRGWFVLKTIAGLD